ncbi:hypothetical protein BV898_05076 [Hypsibius exemplaris]|uniref:Uncharacterized protein n=1 Tax=Hypsibius exemplaris TaxID=2072580 RepID=A0A1W0X0N7_HYPEX|nr:hypothetical protein BV898_05076 [Hypsibius exemplaris]
MDNYCQHVGKYYPELPYAYIYTLRVTRRGRLNSTIGPIFASLAVNIILGCIVSVTFAAYSSFFSRSANYLATPRFAPLCATVGFLTFQSVTFAACSSFFSRSANYLATPRFAPLCATVGFLTFQSANTDFYFHRFIAFQRLFVVVLPNKGPFTLFKSRGCMITLVGVLRVSRSLSLPSRCGVRVRPANRALRRHQCDHAALLRDRPRKRVGDQLQNPLESRMKAREASITRLVAVLCGMFLAGLLPRWFIRTWPREWIPLSLMCSPSSP